MRKITTYGRIEDGTLKIAFRGKFDEAIGAMPPGRVLVTVERLYNRRSLMQNAWLHGFVIPAVRDGLIAAGYSPAECSQETVKDLLKSMFAKKELVNEKTGEILPVIQQTSAMSTIEFAQFCEEIIAWAAEFLGIEIPAPGEQTKLL